MWNGPVASWNIRTGWGIISFALALGGCAREGRLSPDVPPSLAGAFRDSVSVLAADSSTAVLVVTAECAKCRIGVGGYDDVREMARRVGFAFRSVIASNPVAARQFSVLLPEVDQVAVDPDSSVLRTLRVKSVPALVLVDRSRRRRRVLSVDVPAPDTMRLRQRLIEFR